MILTNPNLPIIFIIIILIIVSPITWASDSEMRYITVTGHGKISAVPDTAWVSCGVHSQARTATEALKKNNNFNGSSN